MKYFVQEMIIDTQKTTIRLQLRRLIFLLILTVFIVLVYYLDIFRDNLWGISRNTYVFAGIILFLVYYLSGILRNYHYFFYSDNGSKLIFRYYSLSPLSKRQNAIEMNKNDLNRFEINQKFAGLQRYVVLYQTMPNHSVAKYKPVSISLLNKKQRHDLLLSLGQYGKSR